MKNGLALELTDKITFFWIVFISCLFFQKH